LHVSDVTDGAWQTVGGGDVSTLCQSVENYSSWGKNVTYELWYELQANNNTNG